MARLSKKKVTEQILELKGNISAVARKFRVSRKHIYRFIKEKHPELWEIVEEAREMMLDDAESKLYKHIEDDNLTALIFYLKTQGKKRGWVERQEITGKEGEPPKIIFSWDDGDEDKPPSTP